MTKLLYRIDEVTELIGLGRSKVYQLIQRGEIRSVRVDGVIRVPASAVQEFVAALEGGAGLTTVTE